MLNPRVLTGITKKQVQEVETQPLEDVVVVDGSETSEETQTENSPKLQETEDTVISDLINTIKEALEAESEETSKDLKTSVDFETGSIKIESEAKNSHGQPLFVITVHSDGSIDFQRNQIISGKKQQPVVEKKEVITTVTEEDPTDDNNEPVVEETPAETEKETTLVIDVLGTAKIVAEEAKEIVKEKTVKLTKEE